MDVIARTFRQPGAILALAALALVAGGTAGASGAPLEVSGLVLEPISPSLPGPCDEYPAGRRGCSCCKWAAGAESGSDWFNLFVMSNLSPLPGGYQFVCDQARLVSNLTVCCVPESLLPGQAAGYLVQGGNLSGTGILGRSSTGVVIPAILACP